ncbi:MAG TPA: aldo/keto reductase [Candidatus Kapabacteria bacterium]|nr:aldo/keto reductase [Candidatus Kapabacteria bacterium]
MFATPQATARYHERFPGYYRSVLGRTGLAVSGAGFGGYRVSAGIPSHGAALEAALRSGVNLVDTSANYADGGSERLIGETIARLVAEGSIARQEIVVVTKGGYIQGSNYAMARERVEAGSGFLEVVEYAEGLWHCISPEFLEDQITRSLDRLAMPGIDLYLLHNPEYYLSWAAKHRMPLDEARAEYYRRIRNAFEYLESEVERGRIAWYGISSNSIPHAARDPDFTSLEECVRIAEMRSLIHHFAAVQLPANLVERGFVTEQNQSGGRTAIAYAREKNLGVLINRPLNAITGSGLVRLADFPSANQPFNEGDVQPLIMRAMELEEHFRRDILPGLGLDAEAHETVAECATIGGVLDEHWQSFGGIERYNDLLAQVFAPRLNLLARLFGAGDARDGEDAEETGGEVREWSGEYLPAVRELLRVVGLYYARSAQRRSDRMRAQLHRDLRNAWSAGGASVEGAATNGEAAALRNEAAALRNEVAALRNEAAATPAGTLSSLAIRMLLGVEGVDTVLVGMRRLDYVEDVLAALAAGPLGGEAAWRAGAV